MIIDPWSNHKCISYKTLCFFSETRITYHQYMYVVKDQSINVKIYIFENTRCKEKFHLVMSFQFLLLFCVDDEWKRSKAYLKHIFLLDLQFLLTLPNCNSFLTSTNWNDDTHIHQSLCVATCCKFVWFTTRKILKRNYLFAEGKNS